MRPPRSSSPDDIGASRIIRGPKRKHPGKQARDLRRAARKLASDIEDKARERHDGYAAGDPDKAEEGRKALHDRPEGLLVKKRAMRREIYVEVPELEGRPFGKGQPGVGA